MCRAGECSILVVLIFWTMHGIVSSPVESSGIHWTTMDFDWTLSPLDWDWTLKSGLQSSGSPVVGLAKWALESGEGKDLHEMCWNVLEWPLEWAGMGWNWLEWPMESRWNSIPTDSKFIPPDSKGHSNRFQVHSTGFQGPFQHIPSSFHWIPTHSSPFQPIPSTLQCPSHSCRNPQESSGMRHWKIICTWNICIKHSISHLTQSISIWFKPYAQYSEYFRKFTFIE